MVYNKKGQVSWCFKSHVTETHVMGYLQSYSGLTNALAKLGTLNRTVFGPRILKSQTG